jgi:hypothetical protein
MLDPRINFAISTRGGKPGVDHLGIQTDTEQELAPSRWRAKTREYRYRLSNMAGSPW